MRFILSFLILARLAWCENSLSEAEVCADTAPITNITGEVNTSTNAANGYNGYWHEVWTNSESGSNRILLYNEDAAFRGEWDNPDDFLGRVGLRWGYGATKKYADFGNMVAEYTYTRSGEKTAGERYNFIGIYGWTLNESAVSPTPWTSIDASKGLPLVEFYIIDDWFGNDDLNETDPIPETTACHDSPTDWVCQKGSFTVDGAEYKIYTNWRVNKPSVVGDTTFLQIFSIRQSYRKCGKITISEHFKKWNSLNLKTGILFEASLLVEVQKGKGFIDFTHARVLTNVPIGDLETPVVTYAPACDDRTPDAGGSCGHTLDLGDAPPCYVLPDNKCGGSCPDNFEPQGNKCVAVEDKDEAYTHAVRWGCWALCLLFVVLVL